ncbi:hypothetical protein JGU71_26315 [Antrihabitans sp. YC3-6]|uniref:Uncharacterized protein n=1 Tax=Antrihabitans stalagmiti TaxID=2799499 RepID=A0A934NVZ3_9NOCA|nr:hypothetical protein [Antrihabitans stalagmiti]MBJ8342411.1 hypothetical protein [Antrihabitans stalagmiti]
MGRHSIEASPAVGRHSLALPTLVPSGLVPAGVGTAMPFMVTHHAVVRGRQTWSRGHIFAAAAVAAIGAGAVGTVLTGAFVDDATLASATQAAGPAVVPPLDLPSIAALVPQIPAAAALPPVEVPVAEAAAAPVVPGPVVAPVVAPLVVAPVVAPRPEVQAAAPPAVEAPAAPVPAAAEPTKVGQPESGTLLFPGETPPPPLLSEPAEFQQWLGNHMDMKVRWLEGK